jgi:sugar O-acyltransferase (sialic acid O-acetyltransferase NeuD family)
MKNVLAIIGAGDLGLHIAHYSSLSSQFSKIVFFDDSILIGTENNYGKIVGKIADINKFIESDNIQNLLVGIGYKHMFLRKKLFDQFNLKISFPNIIHSSCYIDKTTIIGQGNILLPGCIIDKNSQIGNNNFFNPGCTLAHDCNIQNHTFFGPGVTISGFVRIGSCCFFGTRTTTIDNISIGDNINTGAGAVIIEDITYVGTYIGIPALRKR